MKRLLIAISIGVFLTALFFALAGFFGGACHCVTPTTIFFPYAAIILESTNWESISFLLMALQFPIYAIIIANVKKPGWRTRVFLIMLAFHVAATLVGLKVYER